MPTKLAYTTINHTAAVRRALRLAAATWPEDAGTDSKLIQNIVTNWADTAERQQQEAQAERAARIRAAAGRFSGVYGPNYLEEIREGWLA